MVVLYHLNLFKFFYSHFQNNSVRHHQLVFYFIFKRNIVKSKYDFFRVDLNLKKIKESIPKNSGKINKKNILHFELLVQS